MSTVACPSTICHTYISCVYLHSAVYFDQLEEGGKQVEYTVRFPYEYGWFTRELTDDFASSFIRDDRYIWEL